jgi:hypothetical protein
VTRWKAAAIHLSLSLAVGIAAFSLLYFVYYPRHLFSAAGADRLVMILLAVDVIIGPFLTLAVYKQGKWGMKFDLAVIGLLQLGALIYGLYIMWQSRPVFVVAVVDRIELVYASHITQADLDKAERPEYRKMPLFGPKWVSVRERKGDEVLEVVDSALKGRDVQYFPKFYVPWGEDVSKTLETHAISLEKVPGMSRDAIEAALNRAGRDRGYLLPVQGRTDSQTLIFERGTGRLIGSATATPW